MRDVFITHRWHGTAEFDRVLTHLDQAWGLNWRNFGTPWHDPVLRSNSPDGMATLLGMIDLQITPAQVVILVPAIYTATNIGRACAERAVNQARHRDIPVIGILADGESLPPPGIDTLADRWVALAGLADTLDNDIFPSRSSG